MTQRQKNVEQKRMTTKTQKKKKRKSDRNQQEEKQEEAGLFCLFFSLPSKRLRTAPIGELSELNSLPSIMYFARPLIAAPPRECPTKEGEHKHTSQGKSMSTTGFDEGIQAKNRQPPQEMPVAVPPPCFIFQGARASLVVCFAHS